MTHISPIAAVPFSNNPHMARSLGVTSSRTRASDSSSSLMMSYPQTAPRIFSCAFFLLLRHLLSGGFYVSPVVATNPFSVPPHCSFFWIAWLSQALPSPTIAKICADEIFIADCRGSPCHAGGIGQLAFEIIVINSDKAAFTALVGVSYGEYGCTAITYLGRSTGVQA